jgi:AraC-like DNA-binding protein
MGVAPGAEAVMLPARTADPLSDVLRSVRLTSALFFLWDVSWPYASPVPEGRAFASLILPGAQQVVSYHIVREGSCWGGVLGGPPHRLEAGDVLLIPHGDAYVIASSEELCGAARLELEPALAFFRQMAAEPLSFEVAEGGGGAVHTHLICGFLGCDLLPFNPALAALPRLVRVRPRDEPTGDRLAALIEYALAEARQPSPGGRSVLLRLGELMFVEIVRRCLGDTHPEAPGWLSGLRDPLVGRALALLHERPSASWSVDTLAAEAGTSRSRLAENFTRLVGCPPMQYLAQWRIQLAARALADGADKVANIAREVGYDSEAAFSRAFKRFAGVSPSEWRRRSR